FHYLLPLAGGLCYYWARTPPPTPLAAPQDAVSPSAERINQGRTAERESRPSSADRYDAIAIDTARPQRREHSHHRRGAKRWTGEPGKPSWRHGAAPMMHKLTND